MVLLAIRLLCVLLPVLGLVPAASVAQVAQSPAREAGLWWNAPAGCPDQAEVAQRLARIPALKAYVVEAEVERAGEVFSLRLRVTGARQHFERTLQAQSCEVLAQSAVWLIELGAATARPRHRSARVPIPSSSSPPSPRSQTSDLAVALRRASDAPTEPSSTASRSGEFAAEPAEALAAEGGGAMGLDPSADDTQPVLLDSGPPRTTDVRPTDAERGHRGSSEADEHLRAGLGAAAVDIGLGGVRPHLAADVTLVLAAFSFAARAGVLLPAELWVASDARLRLWTATGQLLACRSWQLSRFHTGPCATFSVLHTRVDTQGLAADAAARGVTWLVAGAAWQLGTRVVRQWWLGAELGFALPISARPSFEVSERAVAQAAAISGYGQLSAIFEIW